MLQGPMSKMCAMEAKLAARMQTRPCHQLTLRIPVKAQVTQKYLEHLVSQREFDKTAAACAKLLKVRSSFSVHPAIKEGTDTI